MKHLEVEQNERINATYKSRVRADEEPMFYGTRRLDVSAFSNGDEIASAILSKLAQTIERSSARPITSSRSTASPIRARILYRSAYSSTQRSMNSAQMS